MQTLTLPEQKAPSPPPSPQRRPVVGSSNGALNRPDRWFYTFAGVVMLALTAWGFQAFYLQGKSFPGRDITPPIKYLVIAHGLSMTAWIVLGIVQPLLIATRNHRVHMRLGWVAAGLAVAIVVLGVMVGIRSAQVTPPEARIMGFTPKQFMSVPVISVLVFAVLVGIGVWQRKRPAVHRAMMLTATLATISAALNRIPMLNGFYQGTVWDRVVGPFFVAVLIGGVLLAVRCVMVRKFDRHLAMGYAAVVLVSVGIVALARTSAWDAFASVFVS